MSRILIVSLLLLSLAPTAAAETCLLGSSGEACVDEDERSARAAARVYPSDWFDCIPEGCPRLGVEANASVSRGGAVDASAHADACPAWYLCR